jgi:hypothetical protein
MPQIEDLGTETYEGEACLKRRVSMVAGGTRSDMVMLFSPKQKNMPVKMTATATLPAVAGSPAVPVQSTILFATTTSPPPPPTRSRCPPTTPRRPACRKS